jgi:LmbE family N-acetylglucosaminyl deacetylase
MEKLGLQAKDAEFFGLPDQGLLPLWRKQDSATLELFSRCLKAGPPDLVVVPSPRDHHPDHRGAYHFTMEALVQCGQRPAVFSYLIHPGLFRRIAKGPALSLTPEQQAAKLAAILCHQTQISLSRGRFCSYAAPEEIFIREPLPETSPVLQPAARVG